MRVDRMATIIMLVGGLMSVPAGLHAQTPSQTVDEVRVQLEQLRQEFEAVRVEYGDRLLALELQLAALEGDQPAAVTAAAPRAEPPVEGTGATGHARRTHGHTSGVRRDHGIEDFQPRHRYDRQPCWCGRREPGRPARLLRRSLP